MDVVAEGIEFVLMLPGMVLTYLIINVTAGLAGRLLRRRGRHTGQVTLAVVLVLAYIGPFMVTLLTLIEVYDLPVVLSTLVDMPAAAAVAGTAVVTGCAALPQRRRTGPILRVNTVARNAVCGLAVVVVLLAVPTAVLIYRSVDLYGWFDRVSGVVMAAVLAGCIVVGGIMLFAVGTALVPSSFEVEVGRHRLDLYVRPFETDHRPFHLTDTFEGFLRHGVVGVLVALGNPSDRLPPAAGAKRAYASDSDWRETFQRLAARAACILTAPVHSENTAWELSFVRRVGLQSKLFVLTPPAPADGTDQPDELTRYERLTGRIERANLALYEGRFRDLVPTLQGKPIKRPPPVNTWPEFATTLLSCGYGPIEDPGPGAVLTFDADGKPVLLAHDATRFDQYRRAIRARLRTT